MNSSAHQRSRPPAIYIALLLLLAVVGTSLVGRAGQADWNNPLVYVKYGVELIMLGFPVWFIFGGRNWARWLLVAFALGGFCISVPQLTQHLNGGSSRWLWSYGLRNGIVVLALAALFVPSSSRWFRANPDAAA